MNGKKVGGIFLLLLGLWLWLSNLGVLNFGRDWPFILVIIGLYLLSLALLRPTRRKGRIREILKELEKGEIGPEEALKRIKEEKE